MKVIAISLFFLFCLTLGLAQTNKIDSLNRLVQAAHSDTAKINLTIQIVDHLVETNLDSGILVAEQVIATAKKVRYSKGEAQAQLDLATIYCFKGNYVAAAENLRTAEHLFTLLADSTGLGFVYSGYGMMYGMQTKYDSAKFFYEKVIRIAKLISNSKMLSSAL